MCCVSQWFCLEYCIKWLQVVFTSITETCNTAMEQIFFVFMYCIIQIWQVVVNAEIWLRSKDGKTNILIRLGWHFVCPDTVYADFQQKNILKSFEKSLDWTGYCILSNTQLWNIFVSFRRFKICVVFSAQNHNIMINVTLNLNYDSEIVAPHLANILAFEMQM